MVVAYTERRAGREGALLFGVQSGFATIVDDFTLAGNGRIWSSTLEFEAHKKILEMPKEFMSRLGGLSADFDTGIGPEGSVIVQASPESVEIFLRSAWGGFAAGVFTRATQVAEFLTLGWVEDRFTTGASVKRLVRNRDVVIHDLTIDIESTEMVMLSGLYWGSARSDRKLDALSGVTLPAAPMQDQDDNVFQGRDAVLTRDPAGDNEKIAFESVRLKINRNIGVRYFMSDGWRVYYRGSGVSLELETQTADEIWNVIDKTNGQVGQDYKLTVSAPSPAKTLTMDLRDVIFRPGALGHDGQDYRDHVATAWPRVKSGGAYLDLALA